MGSILEQLIGIYKLIVFANVILSWIVHLRNQNTTVRQLYLTTSRFVNPVLDPIRQLLRPLMGNIPFDISPIVLIILLQLLQKIVVAALG